MKYIIVWHKSGKFADIKYDGREPNVYDSVEAAVRATETWLVPYSEVYYDIIEWPKKKVDTND